MIGAGVAGIVSDLYGRKRAYMGSLSLWIAFGAAGYFVDNPYVW